VTRRTPSLIIQRAGLAYAHAAFNAIDPESLVVWKSLTPDSMSPRNFFVGCCLRALPIFRQGYGPDLDIPGMFSSMFPYFFAPEKTPDVDCIFSQSSPGLMSFVTGELLNWSTFFLFYVQPGLPSRNLSNYKHFTYCNQSGPSSAGDMQLPLSDTDVWYIKVDYVDSFAYIRFASQIYRVDSSSSVKIEETYDKQNVAVDSGILAKSDPKSKSILDQFLSSKRAP
jgi:hypothetical protein